ncbi:hypothetical protein CRYUN_Cryun22dG0023200 [Craigia yunnanensis]
MADSISHQARRSALRPRGHGTGEFGHERVATSNSNWQPARETGDCDGRLQCNGLIGIPPATLVQVALQGDKGKTNFYDVSLVDGYNLPVSVPTRPFPPKCTIGSCSKNLNLCPRT